MVNIILRNGKRLQYNDGNRINVNNGTFLVEDKTGEYLIARIPIDIVERAEFGPPCIVAKTRIRKNGGDY